MKDELDELTTDASSRKTATDWLMKVISRKNPINLRLNGLNDEDGEAAVAGMVSADAPGAREWVGEFGAEDLCGAPAVPVIEVARATATEVTADDVCWVPEERRLKSQPMAEAASRLLQMTTPFRDDRREPETRQPEMRKPPAAPVAEEFYGETALAADLARIRRSSDEVAVEDITREPAPYVVEPMPAWGSFSDSFHASDVVDRPITEADISRDWMVESINLLEEKGKDGVVLPFSFKVLKSKEAVPSNGPAAPVAQFEPLSAPIAQGGQVEAIVSSSAVNGAATTYVAEATALPEIAASAAAVELEPSFAVQPESVAAAEEEAPLAVAPSDFATCAPEPEFSTEPEAAVEIEPPPASEPPQSLEAAGFEPHTIHIEDEGSLPVSEAVAAEAVPEEIAPESGSRRQPESVFAREGFWKDSVPEEAAASEEAPLNIDRKSSNAVPEGENLDGSDKPPEEWVSAWKALLRIGSVLPWLAKSLPAVEAGGAGESASALGEVRQDVAGLRLVQYEIRTTVQDHTLQLKRMDEQLGRIQESLESKSSNSADLVENVESMSKLVRIVGIGLGGLVLVLILLVVILLAHGR